MDALFEELLGDEVLEIVVLEGDFLARIEWTTKVGQPFEPVVIEDFPFDAAFAPYEPELIVLMKEEV